MGFKKRKKHLTLVQNDFLVLDELSVAARRINILIDCITEACAYMGDWAPHVPGVAEAKDALVKGLTHCHDVRVDERIH